MYMHMKVTSLSQFHNVAADNQGHERQERQLIHVVSPYVAKDPESAFAPLSYEQYSMLASIRNAQKAFNSTSTKSKIGYQSVMVVCAILPDEYDVLYDTLSSYCQRVERLHRHTGMEYPKLLNNTKLPFLQDIAKAGISRARSNDEDYYLMLTNADICLTSNFYTELSNDLAESKRRAFSINRKVLSYSEIDIPSLTNSSQAILPHTVAETLVKQAHDLIQNGKFKPHGGFDCFIMHASVVKSFNFGNQFVGFPFWGTNIDFALHIMTRGYKNIKSKQTSWGTFHIGNDNKWMPSKMMKPDDDKMTEWKKFDKEDLAYIVWCPVAGYPPQDKITLQNLINCGKWFRPKSNNQVPAFVNAGYEEVYLKNFAKYLNSTPEGLPIVHWKRKTDPKTRGRWIQKWG